jgi:NADPH:quinone reductase
MEGTQMSGKRFVLTGVRTAGVEAFRPPTGPGFGECIIRIEHSLVSPGTELLSYRSYKGPEPFCPGYTAVGRVEQAGSGMEHMAVDKPMFFFSTLADMTGCHASHKRVQRDAIWVPIPEKLETAKACYARMINVAMTPFCHLTAKSAGYALIVGLGLVGNIAGQIARIKGYRVIGSDPDAARRQRALDVGFDEVIDPNAGDAVAGVKRLTEGQGANLTINATGAAATFMMSVEATAAGGEVSTLGGARGEAMVNLSELLHKHVQGRQVTLRGGWEVLLPRTAAAGSQTPSTQENLAIAMRWLAESRINVEALWTHRIKPEEMAEAYAALDRGDAAYQGVTVDWR